MNGQVSLSTIALPRAAAWFALLLLLCGGSLAHAQYQAGQGRAMDTVPRRAAVRPLQRPPSTVLQGAVAPNPGLARPGFPASGGVGQPLNTQVMQNGSQAGALPPGGGFLPPNNAPQSPFVGQPALPPGTPRVAQSAYGLAPNNYGADAFQIPPQLNQGEPPAVAPSGPRVLDRDIIITAPETTTGRFQFGVGVNSSAGLTGSLVVDEQNFDISRWPRSFAELRSGNSFRGAGQHLRLEAMPGTQLNRYSASFTEPYLFDTAVSLGLNGFYYTRSFLDWNEQRLGGRVSLGYEFTKDLTGTVSVRAEEVKIFSPSVPTPDILARTLGSNEAYGFQTRLVHDTRDSAFLPTQGHYIEGSFEQTIGSFQYPRGAIDVRQYFMLHERPDRSGRHVISLASRFGISGSNTPIYERFFQGQPTLRGFRFRGASPKEGNVTVGGNMEWVNSAEYLFPITADDLLRGIVFVDFGTVEENYNIDWDNFRVSPGFGVRVSMPALGPAPIALDFAFPINKAPFDREQIFSFSVGLLR